MKHTQRKAEHLENIIQNLSSPVKKGVMKTVFGKEDRKLIIDEVLAYTPNEDIYEARMCEVLLKELTELHQSKKYSVFHKKLYDLFGE